MAYSYLWNFGDGTTSKMLNPPIRIFLRELILFPWRLTGPATLTKTNYVSLRTANPDDRFWVASLMPPLPLIIVFNFWWFPGASIPDSTNNAYFDEGGSGNCTINSTVSLKRLP
jgi:hypothetical protein